MKTESAKIGRRGFVGGILAGVGMAGCRSTGLFAAKPDLTFGVISDLHVTTLASTGMFRRALRYFRSRGVDAVMVVGEDGSRKGEKRFLSPGFYLPRSGEPAAQHFLYNGFDLPETGHFHLEIVARNCFGAESRPIQGAQAPQPSSARARARSPSVGTRASFSE